jgi:hypothetical protein
LRFSSPGHIDVNFKLRWLSWDADAVDPGEEVFNFDYADQHVEDGGAIPGRYGLD